MENGTLSFDCNEFEGGFIAPDTAKWDACCDDLVEVLDTSLYPEDVIAGFQYIIGQEPNFIDAYAHIGLEYLKGDMLSEAENILSKGLDIALRIIPENFTGTIPWHHTENRPFLRLHHGYILCQLEKGKLKDAIKLMEQHLAWNPNDNIGVRLLVEEACRQAGIIHIKYNGSNKGL